MFDWYQLILILLISFPGNIINNPLLWREDLSKDKYIIKKKLIAFFSIIYHIFCNITITSVFILLGLILNPIIDSKIPLFNGIIKGEKIWSMVLLKLLWSSFFAVFGIGVFAYLYYLLLRPKVSKSSMSIIETLRIKRYLVGRILYDAVAEEIIFRWGILSLIIWGMKCCFRYRGLRLVLISLILLSLLISIAKFLIYLFKGCKRELSLFILVYLSNFWIVLVFGLLFYWKGLAAAIFGHIIFNILLYPFDIYCYNERKKTNK